MDIGKRNMRLIFSTMKYIDKGMFDQHLRACREKHIYYEPDTYMESVYDKESEHNNHEQHTDNTYQVA